MVEDQPPQQVAKQLMEAMMQPQWKVHADNQLANMFSNSNLGERTYNTTYLGAKA